jgi:two-component system, cell cycle sensor histidine kinase and response regulator CckA
MNAPRPSDEDARLAVLRQYGVLDTPSEQVLDDLTALAAHICQTPISLISLVDHDRQWFKSRFGFEPRQTSREVSFCAHALESTTPFVVPDATKDPRFADNPLVTGEPRIRFYAAAPLRSPEGPALGTICVVDHTPRELTEAQVGALSALSRQVMAQLELKRNARRLRDREEQLRLALDAAHLGTFYWDVPARRMTWSRLHEELWGFEPGGFPGTYRAFAERVHPDDLPAVRAAIDRCQREHSPYDTEFRVVWPDGSVHWVHGRGEFVFDDAGRAVRMRGVVLDVTARKTAEAAIRENEERFKEAQRHAGIGSWRYLPDGALFWSDQMYELFPLPRHVPPTYEAMVAAMHPDDLRNGVHHQLEDAVRSGALEYRAEYRVVWPGNRIRTLFSQGTIRRKPGGEVVEVVGTVQDVTERTRAEQRIRKLNRVYAMLSAINETIVRERRPETILQAACRIAVETGGFLMATIGLIEDGRLSVRAHWGADDATLDIVRGLIERQPPAGCSFTTHTLATGLHAICHDIAHDPLSVSWREEAAARGYRSLAVLPLTNNGTVIGTFSIYAADTGVFDAEEMRLLDELATDISFALDVHKRETARQQVEERFRQVVENIREVFWITDGERRQMLYVSPAYETIWGRTRESLYEAPQSWLEAVPADDRERVAELARTRLHTGEFHETFRIVQPHGATRWIRARAFPVRTDDGRVERIVGFASDITEQHQLEDQLRQSQKMESMGRLAGGIAHDFNNLLTVINGTADLAAIGLRTSDPLRADLAEIRLAGDRAAALTRQLLALSRQQMLKPAVINLSTIVLGLQDMLNRLIGEDVELVVRAASDLGSVKADPGQMEQVLLNLAVNARDAMPDGGTLALETQNVVLDESYVAEHPSTSSGPHVMVAVTDTGTGMDEATRQHIFEPFFTTKELGKGTGLGLSTVYGIVQQSGGSIWVYSEPGHGTTFKIYLPRVDEDAPAVSAEPAAATAPGTETILLVEDEHALRVLTRRILESAGYTVIEAANGTDALAALEAHDGVVHLLLTDVVMPKMNGRELAGRVAALRPGIKVIFASGYTDDAILRHGVLDAGSPFISKPYTPTELKRRVREVLDKS